MPIDQISSLSNNTPSLPGLSSLTGTLQGSISILFTMGSSILDRILPPPQREALKRKLTRFATEKPYLASFLFSQIVFSGLPIFLFVIMVISIAIFALITGLLVGLLGAVLFILAAVGFALIVLLPILFFTTFAAVGIWLFGVGMFYLVRHFGQGGEATNGNGLGQADQKNSGESQGQTNRVHDKIEEKQNDKRPTKLKSADERENHAVKKRSNLSDELPETKTNATNHVKSVTSGVSGVTNGVGNAVGVTT